MSGYYLEGSMMGSGIYVQDWVGTIECATCEQEFGEVEGQTDDWGNFSYADCPKCGAEVETQIASDYDEPADLTK